MQTIFTSEWFEIQIIFAKSRVIVSFHELQSLRNEL